MRGRLHHVILDCPDPRGLARFYSALLNHPITYASDDYVVVAASSTTSGLAFQLAPDHRAPTWPDTSIPQQMHLDHDVEVHLLWDGRVRQVGARSSGASWNARPEVVLLAATTTKSSLA